jgi:hypothetical protein
MFRNEIRFVENKVIEVFGKTEALSDGRFKIEYYILFRLISPQIEARLKLQLASLRIYDKK